MHQQKLTRRDGHAQCSAQILWSVIPQLLADKSYMVLLTENIFQAFMSPL